MECECWNLVEGSGGEGRKLHGKFSEVVIQLRCFRQRPYCSAPAARKQQDLVDREIRGVSQQQLGWRVLEVPNWEIFS